MPTYCYRTECGKRIEREFPMGEAPEKIRTQFGMATRNYVDENKQIGRILSDDDLAARRKQEEFLASKDLKEKEKAGKYVVVDKSDVETTRGGSGERLLATTEANLQKLQESIRK